MQSGLDEEQIKRLGPLMGPPPDRPYVIAQLGQSLDGRIATPTGESRYINGQAALDHLHLLMQSLSGLEQLQLMIPN